MSCRSPDGGMSQRGSQIAPRADLDAVESEPLRRRCEVGREALGDHACVTPLLEVSRRHPEYTRGAVGLEIDAGDDLVAE